MKFHNEIGLVTIDCKLLEDWPGMQWRVPNQNNYRQNKRHIQNLLHKINKEVATANEDNREEDE